MSIAWESATFACSDRSIPTRMLANITNLREVSERGPLILAQDGSEAALSRVRPLTSPKVLLPAPSGLVETEG
jgi:hypothetical protein